MFKNKLVECFTSKSKSTIHMNQLSTKGLLFSYIMKVKNGPSVLNTWHSCHIADKPRKLCVHYTSSPALKQSGGLSLGFLRTHIPIWRGERDV